MTHTGKEVKKPVPNGIEGKKEALPIKKKKSGNIRNRNKTGKVCWIRPGCHTREGGSQRGRRVLLREG